MIRIQGVDTSVGLASVNHNEALYRRLLGKFCKIETAFTDKCRELIAAGRAEDLKRLAHDLHSTGAALGALEVAELAATLEAAATRGLTGKPLLGMVDTIESRLAPVLAAISAAIETASLTRAPSPVQRTAFMPRSDGWVRARLW